MMSENSRSAVAAANLICMIGAFANDRLSTLNLDSITGDPAVKIRMSCKDVGQFAIAHSYAAKSDINDLMEIADAEYPKQPTTAAVKFFGLLTAKAADAKRFKELRQKLDSVTTEEANHLTLMGNEISQVAVDYFGLNQAEADRLKNQALAMAGIPGNPVVMAVSM